MNAAVPVDATGRGVPLSPPAARVVSLVPSLTESLVDLGAGDRIAGVTTWCAPALPAGLAPPRVGGVRDPDLASVRRLRPDLVLACVEENRRRDVDALRDDGIAVFVVHPVDLGGAAAMVRDLGRLLGLEAEGRRAAADILARRRSVLRARGRRARLRVLYPVWHRPWMTVGRGTYAAALLGDAGAEVVGGAGERAYPELDLEVLARTPPQVVLLPDEPCDLHGVEGDRLLEGLAARGLPAPRVFRVDGRLAVWYGTRSGRRLQRLAALLSRC